MDMTEAINSYYLFLGRGDYALNSTPLDRIDPAWRPPDAISADPADWSFSWDLSEWERKVDFLHGLGAGRLYFVMNGFELPYPSDRHPELVEPDHANVHSEFFQALVDDVNALGIEVVAALCTTGHCDRAIQLHPEWAGVHADGRRWQCAMCHNNPGARRYACNILEEVLTRYSGFSGVFLHPPELDEYCHCGYCSRAFTQETGLDLLSAGDDAALAWFWRTWARFAKELIEMARRRDPRFSLTMCTIPPVWRRHFGTVRDVIPRDVTLMHWDYGPLGRDARERIRTDIERFRSGGHNIAFAISAGVGISAADEAKLGRDSRTKVEFARSCGVHEICCFVGAVWFPGRIRNATVPPQAVPPRV